MIFSNRYEIIKTIGKGGLGIVYLVKKDNEYYALKKIPTYKIGIGVYNKKIEILTKLSNEYIIKYYESFIEGDYFCILMEYGGELNLKEFIKRYKDRNQLIDERLIKNIIEQICSGLKYIHKLKIIHRNLTPYNILINRKNQIKICDFCSLSILNIDKYYRNDEYSLGMIIYELFTLNDYYEDILSENKEGKIDILKYNHKWNKLIETLLHEDYKKRPNIENLITQVKYIKTENRNIKILEKGNFGEKYLIQGDEHNYILKKISISKSGLSKKKLEEYKDIINLLSKRNNEYSIKYYDSYIEGEYFNILMEYSGDLNLKKFIKQYKDKNQLINENTVKKIILQIIEGIIQIQDIENSMSDNPFMTEENNSKIIVMDDLSLNDIYINENNNIKIGEFFLKIQNNKDYYKYYLISKVKEIKNYNNEIGIYKLGCIIYELLTLNEYDLNIENDIKINLVKYNPKWQNLIELILKNDCKEIVDDLFEKSDIINIKDIFERVEDIKTDIFKIKTLGKGGFGEVDLIQREDVHYALKKIALLNLSEKEVYKEKKIIKDLSKLNNEFIIKYYDYIIEGNYLYILMEYGGDLNLKQFIKQYKDRNQLIDEKLIESIIKQICLGLMKIHNAKFIHRDLTPDNIFISENKKIKIGDFGISIKLNTNKLYAYSKVGKYHYFAPEIEKGEKYYNTVDIYSLGCIIYELFTLNEYFIDSIIDKKVCKINTDIYNPKWQNLIELLLKRDFHERPNILQIFNYMKTIKNEITITLEINRFDINKKIYFLGNSSKIVNLKEMNELNTDLYIDNIKYKFEKYFIPKKEGLYTVKILFHFYIKDCGYMFYNCDNLKSIDLSLFDTKNVTDMNNMFSGCSELKNIDLSSFDTKNVTDMNNMFNFCWNLQNINLSSFKGKNNINIKNIFGKYDRNENFYLLPWSSFCSNLIKVNIKKKFYEKIIKDNPHYKYENTITKAIFINN